MDISNDVVYGFAINEYFGKPRIYKYFFEAFECFLFIHGRYFSAGNHTGLEFYIGEIKGILHHLQLLCHVIFRLRLFRDEIPDIVGKVDHGEHIVLLVRPYAKEDPEHPGCQAGKEIYDRKKQVIEQQYRDGEKVEDAVGVLPEKHFRQELGRDQDNDGGKDGLDDQDDESRIQMIGQHVHDMGFKQSGHGNAIDDQGNVIAQQKRSNES